MSQQQQQQQFRSETQIVGSASSEQLLKTPVKVRGRFLLEDEEFGLAKAQELVRRATAERRSISTVLKLLTVGLRLGGTGLLASMPIEFTRYKHIFAFIALEESKNLVLCTNIRRDHTATVLQFKDPLALKNACNIIDRQRKMITDADATLMSNSSLEQGPRENWGLSSRQQQQEEVQLGGAALFGKKPFVSEIAVPNVTEATGQHADEYDEDLEDFRTSMVFDSHLRLQQQQQQHQQQQHQQQRWQTVEYSDHDAFDDLEAWAVFESPEGPPTLLNELGVHVKELRRSRQQQEQQEHQGYYYQQQPQQQPPVQYRASVHVAGHSGWQEPGPSGLGAANQRPMSLSVAKASSSMGNGLH